MIALTNVFLAFTIGSLIMLGCEFVIMYIIEKNEKKASSSL